MSLTKYIAHGLNRGLWIGRSKTNHFNGLKLTLKNVVYKLYNPRFKPWAMEDDPKQTILMV